MHQEPAIGPAEPATTLLAAYDYDLPPELIAQTPAAERDSARLLGLDRATGAIRHAIARDLPRLLRPGDLLVVNDTRVRPARLRCRAAGGGAVELLLIAERRARVWTCLGRPAKRLRPGAALSLPGGGAATVRERIDPVGYEVEFSGESDVHALLARYGELALPPYIKRPHGLEPGDRERYQTIFAAREGAVAAPTAGLHFTADLLASLERIGVRHVSLTLAVGPATFLPVRVEDVREHHLDAEWAEVPAQTLEALERTKVQGGRVIAVGTTTVRALESFAARRAAGAPATDALARGGAPEGFWADAFILPGFRFRIVDGLLTNFHLPRSTLLMLVSAFAGRAQVLDAYAVAVRERYRFYSYGDAMLIC